MRRRKGEPSTWLIVSAVILSLGSTVSSWNLEPLIILLLQPSSRVSVRSSHQPNGTFMSHRPVSITSRLVQLTGPCVTTGLELGELTGPCVTTGSYELTDTELTTGPCVTTGSYELTDTELTTGQYEPSRL